MTVIWTLIVGTCERVLFQNYIQNINISADPESSIELHQEKNEAECHLKISLMQSLLNFNTTDTGELSHR